MKLNVLDRMMILNVIETYKEGNFATFKSIKDLKLKLYLSEEEEKEFEFKNEGGMYKWNDKGSLGIEIEITEKQIQLIKDQLLVLDKSNKLTKNHISIYDKFIEAKE